MARLSRRWASAWAAGLLAAASSYGCAGEQEALIVLHSLPMPLPDEGCAFDSQSDDFIARGVYDVNAQTGYRLAPVLLNNLVSNENASNTNVQNSELRLEANVDIDLSVPRSVRDGLTDSNLSYSINVATDSLNPGDRYPAYLDLFPAEMITDLVDAVEPGEFADIAVDIGFHATRTGNSSGQVGIIDARAYSFPIMLCNGCLLAACACDGDFCVPDTEQYAYTGCGSVQDWYLGQPFSCSDTVGGASASTSMGDSSTGAPAGTSTSG